MKPLEDETIYNLVLIGVNKLQSDFKRQMGSNMAVSYFMIPYLVLKVSLLFDRL